MQIVNFDLREHAFKDATQRLFQTNDLARLAVPKALPILTRGVDQSTVFHRRFYAGMAEVLEIYESFVAREIAPLYQEPFCYQTVPTFRIQLPNNVAVGEFHVDADYHHPPGELNYWVPLTACWGNNTVWIEKNIGSADYAPVELLPGQLCRFDATRYRHGNHVNDTGRTRVSLDFRCLPLSALRPSSARSVSHGVPFVLGGYYRLFQSAQCTSTDAPVTVVDNGR
jgi:hypothetical protein